MLGSQVLEVAIGLAFVYLILSVVLSSLKELISGAIGMRANTLESGLKRLLSDPSGAALVDRIYDHPLIRGMSKKTDNKPSYIPSRTFTLALFDTLAPIEQEGSRTLGKLTEGVRAIGNPDLQRVLLNFIDEAEGDIEQARRKVEDWFNESMERVAGWYKRKSQVIIVVVAVLTVIVLNVDSVMIANELWRDQTLRAAVVTAAQKEINQAPPGTQPASSQDDPLKVQAVHAELQKLQIPLGWVGRPKAAAPGPQADPRELPQNGGEWLLKVLGLLATVVAVSLGAPFWFDFLKCLLKINPRLSGSPPKPAKSNETTIVADVAGTIA